MDFKEEQMSVLKETVPVSGEKESEVSSQGIEIVHDQSQEAPFRTKTVKGNWQLWVNNPILETRGYTPEEIAGGILLEQERLKKKVTADSTADVDGLRRWQAIGEENPQSRTLQVIFERLAALSSIERVDPEKGRLARRFLEHYERSGASDYSGQLFQLILAEALGKREAPAVDRVVQNTFATLAAKERIEGREVFCLEALSSPDLSFSAKATWWENRFLPRLDFLSRQEKARQEKEAQQISPQIEEPQPEDLSKITPPLPLEAKDEYEQHRGREEKGKGEPIFIIDPYYGGYWEEDCYGRIDEKTGRLLKSSPTAIKTTSISIASNVVEDSQRQIRGHSGTALFSLPLAPGFQLTQTGLSALRQKNFEIYSDTKGHIFLRSPVNQEYSVEIGRNLTPLATQTGFRDTEITEQPLLNEILQELERISNLSIDSLNKALEWRKFVHNFFKYPKDAEVSQMYSHVDTSANRLTAIAEGKFTDCYLAREFFLGGLKRLSLSDLEFRAVNGHYVKGRQKDGTAHLHSGTAHAWVKVRLVGHKDWLILDPTPKGDSLLEGEDVMEEFNDSSPEALTGDELDQLEKEAEAQETKEPKKEEKTEDSYVMEFAQQAGVTEEEAWKILSFLAQVDQLTDRQGRNILGRLKEQFKRIIQVYTKEREESVGLVKMSEGEELEEPVAALLDIRSRVLDPTGFKRRKFISEKEEFYGGFDLVLVSDKSGSMKDPHQGKIKYIEQQKMDYLVLKAAHWFAAEAEKRRLRLLSPLAIKSQLITFQGPNSVEVVKPLGEEFTPVQIACLWKKLGENVGGGTPDHLGLQAVLDSITPEERELLKEKKLLKIVILTRDGGSDNPQKVNDIMNKLRELNVIVADFLIGEAGKPVDQLPEEVAEKVIEASRLLIPKKVKKR